MRASAASSSQYPLQGVSESRVLSDEVPVPSVAASRRQLRKEIWRGRRRENVILQYNPIHGENMLTEYRLILVTPQSAV